MSEDNPTPERHGPGHGHLDADAVCAQCNNVNPEGTLICKVCGNNLRDQRMMRLASDDVLERGGDFTPGRGRLRGALGVLGLLLVLWTMLNIDTIETWLVRAQAYSAGGAAALWRGPDAALHDQLLTVVQGTRYANAEIREAFEALTAPDPDESLDGIYAVVRVGPLGARRLGIAAVREMDGVYVFTAELDGGGEVRGRARRQRNAYVVNWEDAGALYGGAYSAVSGVALARPGGDFDCFGQAEAIEGNFEFQAFRLDPLE